MEGKDPDLEKMLRSGKAIYIENVVFSEEVDLLALVEYTKISKGLQQADIDVPISFINCTFEGKVSGFERDEQMQTQLYFHSSLSFVNCRFKQEVNLRGISVVGRADFSGSTFEGTTQFESSIFYGECSFKSCSFKQEVRFQNTFFGNKAQFFELYSDQNFSMQSAVFMGEASFNAARFMGYADFSLTDFRSKLFFNKAQFNQRADFSHLFALQTIFFDDSTHEKSLFEQANCLSPLSMKGIIILGEIRLKECFFPPGTETELSKIKGLVLE